MACSTGGGLEYISVGAKLQVSKANSHVTRDGVVRIVREGNQCGGERRLLVEFDDGAGFAAVQKAVVRAIAFFGHS